MPAAIRDELQQFHRMMNSQTEWINGIDPKKMGFEFTQAFCQFGDRGVINQMRSGMFGEQGIEIALRLDLQQEDFETRYQHNMTTEYRLNMNEQNRLTAHIME
jgi:hypothetical protein